MSKPGQRPPVPRDDDPCQIPCFKIITGIQTCTRWMAMSDLAVESLTLSCGEDDLPGRTSEPLFHLTVPVTPSPGNTLHPNKSCQILTSTMSPEEHDALMMLPALKPPPNTLPQLENPPSFANLIFCFTIVLLVLNTLLFAMRLFVKCYLTCNISLDDCERLVRNRPPAMLTHS